MKRSMIVAIAVLGLLWAPAVWADEGITLQGTVRPVEWAQEVEVCPVAAVEPQRCAVPKADGTYELRHFSGKFVEFIPTYRSRLLIQYYNHANSLSEAEGIGACEGCALGAIDADLIAGGAIEGKVSGEGASLSDVEVCAIPQVISVAKTCTETDANGVYELHSLLTGSYKVGFWGGGASAAYMPTYFQGSPSLAQATPVEVTAGMKTTEIDTTLAKGTQIGGTVTAQADGRDLEGVSVCLFSVFGATAQRCTESAADGTYSFQGLSSGSYQVGFSLEPGEIGSGESSPGIKAFQPQYYDDVSSRAAAKSILAIAPAAIGGVDAALTVPATFAPPAPMASSVVVPLVAEPMSVSEPKSEKTQCKKGYRRRKLRGKARCLKAAKKARNPPRTQSHHQRAHSLR